LFRAKPLHHIEHVLREFDPIGLLRIEQAMGYSPRGEEMKLEVVRISENCRPWRVEGLTDLAGGRMRLLLKKSENCITKIVLRAFLASRHPRQSPGLLEISLPTSRQPEGAVHPDDNLVQVWWRFVRSFSREDNSIESRMAAGTRGSFSKR
jgi:hypothetical protein